MPKLKTKRGLLKRFKLINGTTIKMYPSKHRHKLLAKSSKKRRELRASKLMHITDVKRIKTLIN